MGARLEERRRGLSPAMREKGSYRDIVTDHDLWVQEYLLSRLLARWPDHGVLGEEGARRQGTSPWTWVLDPIDGTTNYYQAGRGCAISLGLLCRGEPVWGLVLDISSGKAREGSIPYGPGRPGSLAPHQAVLHLGVRTMESPCGPGWGRLPLCPPVSGGALFRLRLTGAVLCGGGTRRRVCKQPSQAVGLCPLPGRF